MTGRLIHGVDVGSAPFDLDDAAADWVETTLAGLSSDEQVGQLFTLLSHDGDAATLAALVQHARPGGLMFRPLPAADVLAGTAALRRESRIPVLVAANLERGGDGIAREGTCVGSPMQVAATGAPEAADWLGTVCGREARAVGIDWAFSPVVDIDMNFRNPITNTRTFGSDPDQVERLSVRFIERLQAHGIAAAAKHFPGDGVDERDQHLVTSSNDLPCEAWDETYGQVFRGCIAAGTKSIMVGHIRQPAWSRRLRPGIEDADLLPASLAPELIEGLLRGHLGFNGLVVSDASVMAGMAVMPRRELVPATIGAGCDMILFAGDLDEDLEAMRWGIESGLIGDARLHAALTRILALKASLGMHRADERASGAAPDADSALAVFRTPEHAAWAREVAARSVTLVKSTKPILPLDPETHHRVLLHDLHGGAGFFDSTDRGADRMLEARLVSEGFEVSRWVSRGGPGGDTAPTRDTVDRYDLIIYLARLATRSNQTTVRVEWAQPMGANTPTFVTTVPTIAISVENPYHLLDMPSVPVFINTYNASPTTIEALVDCLLGRAPFLGASPVDPFCGRWDARV